MSSEYKKEWITLLLKQNFPGWLIADDGQHIFIHIPAAEDLDKTMGELQGKLKSLARNIKSRPAKLGFFIGNTIDSKFFELNSNL